MSKSTDVNLQEAIDRLISDLIRVRCSKVLLSPEMYSGCLDRIVDSYRMTMIAEFDSLLPISGTVFVRGVLAEKCDSLSGTDYALVPNTFMKPPVAWLHILDNTEGIPGNEPQRMLSFSQESPFGVPGVDHAQEFKVTSIALYPCGG